MTDFTFKGQGGKYAVSYYSGPVQAHAEGMGYSNMGHHTWGPDAPGAAQLAQDMLKRLFDDTTLIDLLRPAVAHYVEHLAPNFSLPESDLYAAVGGTLWALVWSEYQADLTEAINKALGIKYGITYEMGGDLGVAVTVRVIDGARIASSIQLPAFIQIRRGATYEGLANEWLKFSVDAIVRDFNIRNSGRWSSGGYVAGIDPASPEGNKPPMFGLRSARVEIFDTASNQIDNPPVPTPEPSVEEDPYIAIIGDLEAPSGKGEYGGKATCKVWCNLEGRRNLLFSCYGVFAVLQSSNDTFGFCVVFGGYPIDLEVAYDHLRQVICDAVATENLFVNFTSKNPEVNEWLS